MIAAGLGGVTRHGCVALSDGKAGLIGVCEQERVTRVRSAGFNRTGLPDEALDTMLGRLGRKRKDVGRYVVAEAGLSDVPGVERIDHHFAHACAAYLSSPFTTAAIVVCDHEEPRVSVWEGRGARVTPVEWPWSGPGFADVYAHFAGVFGFASSAGEQRLEALARLSPGGRDERFAPHIQGDEHSLRVSPDAASALEAWLAGERPAAGTPKAVALASALQTHIGELFVQLLTAVQQRTGAENVCLAGSFFYHSSINTVAKSCNVFREVFVPIDPGNAGLAVGGALHAAGGSPQRLSPFLGPDYTAQETKETLDNCKLHYSWESEGDCIAAAVRALQQGRLVGWFDGRMEWGPRALGARCILANPFAPYLLENLNQFLKRREPWRGYAMSGLEPAVQEHFEGAASAPYMECDYRPRDLERFRHVLPAKTAAIRVQTVGTGALPAFSKLLAAFGAATGVPFLVNTSFNGFHEPIVCSPRDAVRVFYGSGLDLLVLNQFLLRK